MKKTITQLFATNKPIIIDGGLSNVLEAKGCNLNHKLWTAKLIQENPEALIDTHLDYIKAGSQIIATASYQASFPGLLQAGYSQEEAENILLKSVALCQTAIERAILIDPQKPLIAASLGPYGAYLADGSEYKGNYGIDSDELKAFHQERITLFDQSEADLLAFETIPSFEEAKVIAELLLSTSKPAWISFSCQDEHRLNDGTEFSEAAKLFNKHPNVFALGINCTQPKFISPLIQQLKKASNKRIVVYPNSGEIYNASGKRWLGLSEPFSFVEASEEWVKLGADMIGGCCRIGPAHIQSLSTQFN